jgi:hypothetical protein
MEVEGIAVSRREISVEGGFSCRTKLPNTTKKRYNTLRMRRVTTGKLPGITKRDATKGRYTMLTRRPAIIIKLGATLTGH